MYISLQAVHVDGSKANRAATIRELSVCFVKSLLEFESASSMFRNTAHASRDSSLNIEEFSDAVLTDLDADGSNAVITVFVKVAACMSKRPMIVLAAVWKYSGVITGLEGCEGDALFPSLSCDFPASSSCCVLAWILSTVSGTLSDSSCGSILAINSAFFDKSTSYSALSSAYAFVEKSRSL